MDRRLTPIQANYPVPEDFVAMARQWRFDAIEIMLGYVWQGFDKLLREERFDLSKGEESLERDISFMVCQLIREAMDGKPPYYLEHLPPENEKRASAQAAPPTPDLGFIWRQNRRANFPLEAKVLRTDGEVAEYVKEIVKNFLTFRYANFSSEAAMLGYLLHGHVEKAIENISSRLESPLEPYLPFRERNHRYSKHKRTGSGSTMPTTDFLCHHMIILFNLCRE